MRLITRLTDTLVERLAPKATADAACVPAGPQRCGVCQYDHTKYCCQDYDNCGTKCGWKSC